MSCPRGVRYDNGLTADAQQVSVHTGLYSQDFKDDSGADSMAATLGPFQKEWVFYLPRQRSRS